MRRWLALSLTLLAPALAHAEPEKVEAAKAPARDEAPIRLEVSFDGQLASVTVTFDAAAADVTLKARGEGGLKVLGEHTPFKHKDFAAGESVKVPFSFSTKKGSPELIIQAVGKFGTKTLHKVQHFSIGGAAQNKGLETTEPPLKAKPVTPATPETHPAEPAKP
jgi:hypothetical protein